MGGVKTHVRVPIATTGWAAACLAALALFIFYGSVGPWVEETSRTEALPGISLPDIAQNILLYVPFGIFGAWIVRGWRLTRWAQVLSLVAGACAYSTTMELLQMLLAGRIASTLDVIANLVGTVAGIVIATPVEQSLAIAADQTRRTGLLSAPARYVLAAIVAIILVAAWYPFDVTLDISTLGDRTRAIRRDLWLRPADFELWMQGARFCLVAAITAFCLPRLGRWAVPAAAVFSVVLAVIVDAGQVAMGSQPIGLAAFASQLAGSVAGAVAALVVTLARGSEYAAA
jgi:VanZ family protein